MYNSAQQRPWLIAVPSNRKNIRNRQPELTWIWFYIFHFVSKELGITYFLWEIWFIWKNLKPWGRKKKVAAVYGKILQLSVWGSQLHQTNLFSKTAASNSVMLGCFCGFYLGLLLLMWLIYPSSYDQSFASVSTTCFLLKELFLVVS